MKTDTQLTSTGDGGRSVITRQSAPAKSGRGILQLTQCYPLRKGIFMFKTFTSSAQLLLVFLSIAPLLGACHATAGAGRDISRVKP